MIPKWLVSLIGADTTHGLVSPRQKLRRAYPKKRQMQNKRALGNTSSTKAVVLSCHFNEFNEMLFSNRTLQ